MVRQHGLDFCFVFLARAIKNHQGITGLHTQDSADMTGIAAPDNTGLTDPGGLVLPKKTSHTHPPIT